MNVREEIEKMDSLDAGEKKTDFMDIRYFIGLILGVYGIILAVYGLVRPDFAAISLGVNLNLVWGAVLLGTGLIFYIPSKKPGEWDR